MFCTCILDDAIYEPDIFPDSSIFKETRLVVIDDLRQNLFNAIGDCIGCDFVVTVKKGNWSPVF